MDLAVPIDTVSDYNLSAELVSLVVRDHHYYDNPLLGAPGQQQLYDFPILPLVHLLVLAPIGLLTKAPGLALNLFYFLSYPLVTITALYSLRRLGVGTLLAISGSLLFAFAPFHQLRNEGHLVYSCYYLVPLVILVAVWLGTGHPLFRFRSDGGLTRSITRDGAIGIAICVAAGWDNPYFAFFGAAILSVATLLGWIRQGDRRSLISGILLLIVLVASFGAGLLPSWNFVREHGRAAAAQRNPAESEIYGLTIVQMMAPVTNHRIPFFAEWKNRFNRDAVLVNENDEAALGLLASIGFLCLLLCFFTKKCSDVLYSLGILNLFCLLLGTIGGFGAVFSFVLTPQLRGFNRISIYISFLSITALSLVLDSFLSARFQGSARTGVMGMSAVVLLLVGIPDQVPRGLNQNWRVVETGYRQQERFVGQIERLVPPHAMIFQLPYVPFPENPPIHKMFDYDQMKGYLHSGSLRWSYGAMKGRAVDRWIGTVSGEPIDQLLLTLVATGFGGIYIDRYGYDDSAAALESQLRTLLGSPPIADESGRLSFFVLDSNAIASLNRQIPPERYAKLERSLNLVLVEPAQGCWGKESSDSENWHWCGRRGEIAIMNATQSPRKVLLDATFATTHPEDSTLAIDGAGLQQKLKVNGTGTPWQAEITVQPGEQTIRLTSDARQVVAPNDSRNMFFRINNFTYREINP